MYQLFDALHELRTFMDQGGNVLWIIALTTLIMWTLVFERVWYFRTAMRAQVKDVAAKWEARTERRSWGAHQIRRLMISQVSLASNQNLSVIRTLVALCPLLGLLGTVTGMIEVFNVMAVTGGGDAKSMAGGVSRATIPTMAGMVAAISGVFANTWVSRTVERENTLLADKLTMDH